RANPAVYSRPSSAAEGRENWLARRVLRSPAPPPAGAPGRIPLSTPALRLRPKAAKTGWRGGSCGHLRRLPPAHQGESRCLLPPFVCGRRPRKLAGEEGLAVTCAASRRRTRANPAVYFRPSSAAEGRENWLARRVLRSPAPPP